jgi:RNA polymerase sigma-70 factor (ECF subfamily)
MEKNQIEALFKEHKYYIDAIVEKFIQEWPTFRYMKDDWASECYLFFCEKVGDFEPEGEAKFSTWLNSWIYGRLRNLLKKEIRESQRNEAYAEENKDAILCSDSELDEFELMIEDLTENQKQVMRLRFKQDKTEKEIASLLNISQQAVSRTVKRATESLRKSYT